MAAGKLPIIGQFFNFQNGFHGSIFQNEMLFHMYTREKNGFCAKCDLEPQNISDQEGYKLPGHLFHSKASQFIDPLFPNWKSNELFVETRVSSETRTKAYRYDKEGNYFKECSRIDLIFLCGAYEFSQCCRDFFFCQDSQVGLMVGHQFGYTTLPASSLPVDHFRMNLEDISSVPLYVVNKVLHGYIVFFRFHSETMSIEELEMKVKLFGEVIKEKTIKLPTELSEITNCTISVHVGGYWEDSERTKVLKNFESAFKHFKDCDVNLKKRKWFRGVEFGYGLNGAKNYEQFMISESSGTKSELIKKIKVLPVQYTTSLSTVNINTDIVYKLYRDVKLLLKDFENHDNGAIWNLKRTFNDGFKMFQEKLGKAIDLFFTKEGPENGINSELDQFMNSDLNPEKVNSKLEIYKNIPNIPFCSVTYSLEPIKEEWEANSLLSYVCPFSWEGGCSPHYQRWACGVCGQLLRFDHHSSKVNCQCGSLAFRSCGFRCNHPRHGAWPTSLDLLFNKPPRAEINCLLIGESGSGKSTFINSLVNYFLYGTLEDAAHKEPIFLIPTAYTNYLEAVPVAHPLGSDDNEQLLEGRTHTVNFRNYIVPLEGGQFVRFIDSPGFDPESEVTESQVNSFIEIASRHRDVHAICWVIDSSRHRLSQGFVSAFRQMTSLLTEDRRKSFIFIFTHFAQQPINFRLIQQVSDLQAKLGQNQVFKVNNEVFPHLASRLAGQTIPEYDLPRIGQIWAESSKVCKELCDRLSTMEPRSFSKKPIKPELDYNPMEEVVFRAEDFKVSCMLQLRTSGLTLH